MSLLQEPLPSRAPTPLSSVNEPASALTAPPTDDEKYAYLDSAQSRWICVATSLAGILVLVGAIRIAAATPWAWPMFPFLAIAAVEQVVAPIASMHRRRIDGASHRELVEHWHPDRYPSIDVFVPTAGEHIDILCTTLSYAKQLQWRGELTIWLLDDSGRVELERLASDLDVRYLARPSGEFKKAGNLQYALERSSGEHIFILDADFVPRHDALLELMPYMDDPAVGIVQSPQYFSTSRSLGWLARSAAMTQEVFFRRIQPSRDTVRAAICVGTSAIYRRKALEASGGFPRISHSEDIHTGVMVNRAGYTLAYVPVLVTKGLTPDTLDSFIAQQYRWCEGSVSLLLDREFHDSLTMSFRQRVCYWTGFLNYVGTAAWAVLVPVPLLLSLYVLSPHGTQSAGLFFLVVVLAWMALLRLTSYCRWTPEVMRVQLICLWAHMFCITDLLRGRTSEWKATFSGASHDVSRRVMRAMVPFIVASQALTWVGVAWSTLRYGAEVVWVNTAIAALTLYVTMPVALACRRMSRASSDEAPALSVCSSNELLEYAE